MRGPRQHVHRGVVEAAGLLIDEALVGAREARLRAVRAWSPGAGVFRVRGALLVRFAAPRAVDCARAAGAPLVRLGASATSAVGSAPLRPDEIAAVAPPPGSIAIVRADAIAIVIPSEADREDPATYLDLDAFELLRVEPLGAPPGVAQIAADRTTAPRALLGVGKAPAEQAQIVAAIAALRAAPAVSAKPIPSGEAPRAQALTILATVLAAAAGILGRLFPSSAARATTKSSATTTQNDERALAAYEADPPGPSLADRLAARMRTLVAELLVRARLAHLIGRRQAEYLGKLLDMLDRGDLMEALRHAIPLGGKDEGTGPGSPALGVPAPRSDLAISLAQARGGSSMFATDDLYAHLRAKYRAAFERLEREGRIDEAAFVLAELLHEEEEAVAFLERHGKLRLAAELAEARKLRPALVVRQWFIAGDEARAVRIARRYDAFAEALTRLSNHERGDDLRRLWAEHLAQSGDFAAAVRVIWPVAEARRLAQAWIDRGIAQGGAIAAHLLGKKLTAWPQTFPEVLPVTLAIIEDEGPGADRHRRALAEALTTASRTSGARDLARAAARAMIKDAGLSGDPASHAIVTKLVGFAEDPALRADIPTWPAIMRASLQLCSTPRTIEIAAADTGTMEIRDAAHLPNGNTVVALGEAGVRVVARSGKTLCHLDQPADRLVVSDHGDRALAIAPRGEALRLARLDLAGRRSEPWCEAPPLVAAPDFDGSQWPVVASGKLLVIDALDTRFSALDPIDLDIARSALAIERYLLSCAVVSVTPSGKLVRARFDLPKWTLRSRTALEIAVDPERDAVGVHVDGSAAVLTSSSSGHQGIDLVHAEAGDRVRELQLPEALGARPAGVWLRGAWIACAAVFHDRIEAYLVDVRDLRVRARVVMHGAKRAALRLSHETLVVGDDRGRFLVMEHAHGGVVHDLRV